MNLEDKVIPLWLLVYDQDPDQTYLFTSKAKVFASVEGLVRSVAPDEVADRFVDMALHTLDSTWGAPFIPMRFQDTSLFVHRLEIDRYNPIHQALAKCRGVLEQFEVGAEGCEAIGSIDKLFIDPVALSR